MKCILSFPNKAITQKNKVSTRKWGTKRQKKYWHSGVPAFDMHLTSPP